MESPDYESCNEEIASPIAGTSNNNLKTLFKTRGNYVPKQICNIDYYLKNAIDHASFDSDLSIVAYPGCVRIGKLFPIHLLNNFEFGLNKDELIEIPIFLLPKFLKEIQNAIIFLVNNNTVFTPDKNVGETTHQNFLYTKRSVINNEKTFLLQRKKDDIVIYEVKFNSFLSIKVFATNLLLVVLGSTNPSPIVHNITLSFIKKMQSKPNEISKSLYNYWLKLENFDILWSAISEVVFEIENKVNDDLTNFSFNYLKKNIEIIREIQFIKQTFDEIKDSKSSKKIKITA